MNYLFTADPGAGGAIAPIQPEHDNDPAGDARAGRVHRPWDARNGMPESGGYEWQRGEADRDTEIAAQVAAIRAKATAAWAAECGASS